MVACTATPEPARVREVNMRVLVTGAGRAIGRSTCEVLAAAGHEVVATARNVELLEGLEVAQHLALDVTDQASVDACLAAAGELDAIVNNAALPASGVLETMDLSALSAALETNAVGPVRMVQGVAPAWRQRGSGVIVNISSILGKVSTPLSGAYAASKHALEALSEAMHYELRHFGIRTVVIEPGYTAPGMKGIPDPPTSGPYVELYAQMNRADDSVTGGAGRPGPETVAAVVLRAIEDEDSPLRIPVGPDAELVIPTRATSSDQDFEAIMRSVLGLTW